MLNYVKIPREIIYDKTLNDKRAILFSYLCARRSLDDTVAFSTKELCDWTNVKPNYRDGKVNQRYYEVLKGLSEKGYFLKYPDFEECLNEHTNSDKYRCVQLDVTKFDVSDNFAMIYFNEIDKIVHFKDELKYTDIDLKRISQSYILLVLAYIRVNLNYNPEKPLCCYRRIKKIHEDIGLSEKYISRCIEILDALEIIAFKKMKRQKIHGEKYVTTPTVFANYRKFKVDREYEYMIDNDYEFEDEIKKQIEELEKYSF